MTDPTCPRCASPEVGTEQTQLPNGVAESYACDDCTATWPLGTWRDGTLR
jgi:transposase-like protein